MCVEGGKERVRARERERSLLNSSILREPSLTFLCLTHLGRASSETGRSLARLTDTCTLVCLSVLCLAGDLKVRVVSYNSSTRVRGVRYVWALSSANTEFVLAVLFTVLGFYQHHLAPLGPWAHTYWRTRLHVSCTHLQKQTEAISAWLSPEAYRVPAQSLKWRLSSRVTYLDKITVVD